MVRFWAGAQRAAGRADETMVAGNVAEVIDALSRRPELAKVCAASSFLVDGLQVNHMDALHDGAVIDVLPPFAGG